MSINNPEDDSVIRMIGIDNRDGIWIDNKVVLPCKEIYNEYPDAIATLILIVLKYHNVPPMILTALGDVVVELCKAFFEVGYAKCLYNQEQNSHWNSQMEKM